MTDPQTPADLVVREVHRATCPCAAGDMRAAGRWCDRCQDTGSHHTDRHSDWEHAGGPRPLSAALARVLEAHGVRTTDALVGDLAAAAGQVAVAAVDAVPEVRPGWGDDEHAAERQGWAGARNAARTHTQVLT